MKSIASGITTGAGDDDEKIRRIYEYCRKHLKNISTDELIASERDGAKYNKNTAATLKQEIGTSRRYQRRLRRTRDRIGI